MSLHIHYRSTFGRRTHAHVMSPLVRALLQPPLWRSSSSHTSLNCKKDRLATDTRLKLQPWILTVGRASNHPRRIPPTRFLPKRSPQISYCGWATAHGLLPPRLITRQAISWSVALLWGVKPDVPCWIKGDLAWICVMRWIICVSNNSILACTWFSCSSLCTMKGWQVHCSNWITSGQNKLHFESRLNVLWPWGSRPQSVAPACSCLFGRPLLLDTKNLPGSRLATRSHAPAPAPAPLWPFLKGIRPFMKGL
jgi:hypothetical protein